MIKDIQKDRLSSGQSNSVIPLRPASTKKVSSVDHSSGIRVVQRTAPTADSILRCRYEMKYVVTPSKAQALMGFVRTHLPRDRYSNACRGAYPLVSLYLDSHRLQLCRESMEGHKNRFKLRIRSYLDDSGEPCYFEIKRRMDSIILKDRTRVSRDSVPSLLSGQLLNPEYGPSDRRILEQFQLYAASIRAAPLIKVRYMREAYEGGSHPGVRVTFDSQLAFKVVDTPDLSLNGSAWQYYPAAWMVVEIKFTDAYPAWLSQMVRHFDLNRQSMSKYARSVQRSCLMKFCAPKLPIRIVER